MGVITDAHGTLGSPPLVYTLLMLRFPTQTGLDECIPMIQESLKREYPIYEKRVQQAIEVAQNRDGHQTISTITKPEYMFFDSERTKGVLVKEDRVVFHSNVYPSFDEFSSWFKDVAEAVVKALSISHYVGCGIRYIDALLPDYDSGESLDDYLKSSLQNFNVDDEGISGCIGSTQVYLYQTNYGSLTFKSYELFEDDICVPPDLNDTFSLLRPKGEKKKAPFAVLDFDHGYLAPDGTAVDFDLDELVVKIDEMHKVASEAFLQAINPDAIKRWK